MCDSSSLLGASHPLLALVVDIGSLTNERPHISSLSEDSEVTVGPIRPG